LIRDRDDFRHNTLHSIYYELKTVVITSHFIIDCCHLSAVDQTYRCATDVQSNKLLGFFHFN
jgi:hypothetical protein